MRFINYNSSNDLIFMDTVNIYFKIPVLFRAFSEEFEYHPKVYIVPDFCPAKHLNLH